MRGLLKSRLPRGYAGQTHASPYWIIRWPHRQRLRFAADEIIANGPRALLDYGAGDGQLLHEIQQRGRVPDRIVLYEPLEKYAAEAAATADRLGLCERVEVATALPDETFDFVTCLGVLEHMPLPERMRFYRLCKTSLTGRAVIDVPCEVGPTVLIKEFGRRVLKGRDPEFPNRELARCALGGVQFDLERWDPESRATWVHSHAGFDYRLFARELGHHLRIVGSYGSPFPQLPPWLGNQEVLYLVQAP